MGDRPRGGSRAARLALVIVVACGLGGCLLEREGQRPPRDAGARQDGGGVADAGPRDAGAPGGDAGTPAEDAGPIVTVPGAPAAPVFFDVTPASLRVDWAAPTTGGAVATYELERAPDSGGAPGPFASVGTVTARTFADSGLTEATTYHYRVRGVNGVGAGPYSPTSSVTTSTSALVRVQLATDDGFDPTATLGADPTPGNLLVAIAFHRVDDADPSIAGFDLRIDTHFKTDGFDRRGLAVLTRVAQAGDPRAVQLLWSDSPHESHLLLQELSAGAGATWRVAEGVAADTARMLLSELTVAGATDHPRGDYLLVGAFGARDEASGLSFGGLSEVVELGGERSVATAFGRGSGGVMSTTIRWSPGRRATGGLLAVEITR